MAPTQTAKDLRATWGQAIAQLLAPIVLVVAIRNFIVEPFVIPSGSMIPTLLIHDHIFAEKWAYGIHFPGRDKFLFQWAQPQRFDIVVFKYPKNPDVFFVKRVLGLPGDELAVKDGVISINGKEIPQEPVTALEPDSSFSYFQEDQHIVRYQDREASSFHSIKVPEGYFFAMGDNRDQSSDSRVWGFVPMENLVGRVNLVWLSCEDTLPSASYICDPFTLRKTRILTAIH
jgi:signal peptidase I